MAKQTQIATLRQCGFRLDDMDVKDFLNGLNSEIKKNIFFS